VQKLRARGVAGSGFEARGTSGVALLLSPLLIAAFVPVCATLALGGADWHLAPDWEVSWYDEWVAWIGLVVAASIAFARPTSHSIFATAAFVGAFAGLVCSAWILWTGGGRLGPISMGHPDASAWLGLGLLLVSLAPGARVVVRRGRAALGVGLGLVAGLVVWLGLEGVDRRGIEEALERRAIQSDAIASSTARDDLVWIVVDTLRADALGAYRDDRGGQGVGAGGTGHPTPETPALDRLAMRGVVFERAFAPAPWTVPSMSSLLTARHPSSLDPVGRGEAGDAKRLTRLDPEIPTWIGRLREAGYRTIGFQKNPFLGRGSGVEAAFDLYRVVGGHRAEGRSAAQLVRACLRWGDVFASKRSAGLEDPFLLYVHFMDPHVDYRAPEPWLSRAAREYTGSLDGTAKGLHARLAEGPPIGSEDRAQLRRLYAAEVAYLDAQIEDLLEGLRRRGLLGDSTLVVVSSDHGEQFGEHGGWEHGDLHAENVHVPWLMVGPGLSPRRVEAPLAAMDLGPTILDWLGLPALEGAEGVSRVRLLDGRSQARLTAPVVTEFGGSIRWVEDPWVLIEDADGRVELFDARKDPGERDNLAESQSERVAAMRARIAAHRERDAKNSRPALRELDLETRESLRELGYAW
jgi:arylsulfatase A-like enzyme